MAAVLLAAGSPKKRFALPHSRILIHQPWMSGIQGQATDIDIHAKEILRIRTILNKILANHTGQPFERIEKDVERDYMLLPLPQSGPRPAAPGPVPRLATAVGVVVPCLVLAGWALNVVTLKNVFPGQPQMVPNTALAFILASVSLWLLRTEESAGRWQIGRAH